MIIREQIITHARQLWQDFVGSDGGTQALQISAKFLLFGVGYTIYATATSAESDRPVPSARSMWVVTDSRDPMYGALLAWVPIPDRAGKTLYFGAWEVLAADQDIIAMRQRLDTPAPTYAPGPTGLPGAIGPIGSKGADGDPGPQGAQGDTGMFIPPDIAELLTWVLGDVSITLPDTVRDDPHFAQYLTP